MEQNKKLDFDGQPIFCGIDVHKKSWKVTVRTDLVELKTFSQPPSATALLSFLKHRYPAASYRVVYEAGFCGFHLQRQLQALGVDCIIANPADVPTMDKEKQQKSDAVDSRKLSKSLSAGMLAGIHVPTVQEQDDRCVLRNYHQFVRDQTRCKNRLKGWLYFQGVEVEDRSYWSRNFIKRLREMPLPTAAARTSLDLLLQALESAKLQVLRATRALRALSREERHREQVELIRSIPGIGQVHAMLFLLELGDIRRFGSLDRLCAYVGLVPSTRSSGEQERVGRLTHRTNSRLKSALIEASWTAVRMDPALTLAFSQYARKMQKSKAIIKIARKLLNRIRYVLVNRRQYESGVVA